MKKWVRILPFLFLGMACSKDDDGGGGGGGGGGGNSNLPPCQVNRWGEIRFRNVSANPYDVWANNSFMGTISGNSLSGYFTLNEGSYSFRALQKSGYAFFPTERTTSAFVSPCDQLSWTFP